MSVPEAEICAIIPAYNEQGRIADVILRTLRYAGHVIVIDDGSSDDTSGVAERAGALVIRHPHNLGKGAACRSGFYAAVNLGCTYIITLDGDGQHNPDEIPTLLRRADEAPGPCIVLGNRMRDLEAMPWLRRGTNRLLSRLISFLAAQHINDSQCGFRLIHREILEKIQYQNNRFDAESEILVRASREGFLTHEVPITTIYGEEFSKINIFWDTLRFIRFFMSHLFDSPPVRPTPDFRICRDASDLLIKKLDRQPQKL